MENEYRTLKELRNIISDSDWNSYLATVFQHTDGGYMVFIGTDGWNSNPTQYIIRHSVHSHARIWKSIDAVLKSLSDIPLDVKIQTQRKTDIIDERINANVDQVELEGL